MTDTCPPCNHDCNQGRDCPARKKTMPAPTDLAAALLRDVHRHTIRCYVDDLPCLLEADVLAALTAALDGVDERAGEVVGRLRTLGVMFDDASAAADLITAILAQNAALRAERDALKRHNNALSQMLDGEETRAEAAEAERDALAERNKENSRLAEDNAQGLRDAEAREERLRAERDALLRDRDRWSAEAQASASPILAALRAERDEARAAWEIEAATVKRFADRHERNLVLGAETRARADAAEAEVEKLRRALTNLPAVYAHQINTGVREVYDPLQRFYTMESVLAALTETATTEGRHG